MEKGKWQVANQVRNTECEVRNEDARGEQNGKLEMASGKFRNCVADCKASLQLNLYKSSRSATLI